MQKHARSKCVNASLLRAGLRHKFSTDDRSKYSDKKVFNKKNQLKLSQRKSERFGNAQTGLGICASGELFLC